MMIKPDSKSRGDFFAIDHRCWPEVCKLGINAAVAYLTLARGSGGDQRTTSWSTHAIESRTAISRSAAKSAIGNLIARGLIRKTDTGARPKYLIVPAHEVSGTVAFPPEPPDWHEQELLKSMGPEWRPVAKTKLTIARALVAKRLAEQSCDNYFRAKNYDTMTAAVPAWVWLPNSLLDPLPGQAITQPPPIELVRQTQSLPALKLFVELYAAHRLEDAGGVHWRSIRESYTRHKIGQSGQWVVWCFVENTKQMWPHRPPAVALMTGEAETVDGQKGDKGAPIFWNALEKLESLGLLEFVPHLVDADTDEGALIHPCPETSGEPAERALAQAAQDAAIVLSGPEGIAIFERLGGILVPVLAHMGEVAMVGILRLKYRPRTGATASWLAGSHDWQEMAKRYAAIVSTARESYRARTA
jgi:hypothetical protein